MKPPRADASGRSAIAGIAGVVIATLALALTPAPTTAQTPTAPLLTIPNIPWFIGQNVPPNILLTLDDSGSMMWAYAPDAMGSPTYWETVAFKSNLNPMYYNPAIDYRAPVDANDIEYTTSFTAARRNGFDASRGTVNLASAYRPDREYNPASTSSVVVNHCRTSDYVGGLCPQIGVTQNAGTEAYWWTYQPNGTTCPTNPTFLNFPTLPMACFTMTRPSMLPAADPVNPRNTADFHRGNFARWYSFYRTRNLATVSAAMLGFARLPQDYRIAWQALNSCADVNFDSTCRGWDTSRANVNARIGPYTQQKRRDLWTWLERLPASGGTPLRAAVIRAGEYLRLTGAGSPYADDPTASTAGSTTSCRASYSIAMTDGIWNSDSVSWVGNSDNTDATLPDGLFPFQPSQSATKGWFRPYRDSSSNTIADIAFHYWKTDLQPGTAMANTLRPFMPFQAGATMTEAEYWDPRNDPATWQRMTSIFVGLGLSSWLTNPVQWPGSTYAGTVTPPTGFQQFRQGTANWPAAGVNAVPGNVYDLWHAAINSRGHFYAADNPDALVRAFDDLRNRISQREAGASAAGGSTLQVQTDSMMFSTSFNSQRWDGTLRAFRIQSDGRAEPSPAWTSDTTFNHRVNGGIGPHRVLARSSSGGLVQLLPTTISSLPTDRQNELTAQAATLSGSLTTPITAADLVRWVLGDTSNEELRRRDRLLGDLINSPPLYEGGRDFGYGVTAWTDSTRIDGKVYADYVKSKHDGDGAPRTPTVYVGSNDGMLHAFDARTGAHRWAYMPSPSFAKLGRRANPLAGHEWFVDGPIVTHDVHDGTNWRTILVASAGAGARGLFALDITNADSPSLLWEWFPPDTDIGFITGEPVVARAQDGRWIVATGNGYGSVSNEAKLVLMDALGGPATWIRKISVPDQSTTEANGLSSPALLYMAGKRLAYAYAGDLRGRLWKFDLNSTTSGSWTVGFGNKPLFRATDSGGRAQPITAKIRIATDRQLGRMLLFGTGRLLAAADPASTDVQSVYGIFDRDDNQATVTRSDLTAQTITNETGTIRTLSTNPIGSAMAGWRLDLTGTATTSGERVTMAVNYMPELTLMTVSTIRPVASTDPCGSNVTSWVMAMSPFNGRGVALFDGGATRGAAWRLDGIIASPTPIRQRNGQVSLTINAGAAGLAQVQIMQGWNPRASWAQVR